MIILIQGKQGSGKGTQAKMLVEKYGLYFFSTGDLSRKLAKEDPRIDELINVKGQLIPTEEMTVHVSKFLDEKFKGKPKDMLFDGYPRFVEQYKHLSKWLKDRGTKIDAVVMLEISDNEAIKRLSNRRLDPKTGKIYNFHTAPKPGPEVDVKALVQRKDDMPSVIKGRLQEYEKNTLPMIQLIKEEGNLVEVDGERPIDVIHKDIVNRIEKKLQNRQ